MKKLMLLGGIRYLLPVIKTAHKLGIYVITCDYLPNNIAHKFSDEYHNVSIVDKESVLKLAQELKIDGIMSFAVDPGVVTAAYVAEKLNLPFQCSYNAAEILQNKNKFRTFLTEHKFNVPTAIGYSENQIEKAFKDVEKFHWPVIVKPVDSAGSKGVTKVNSELELNNAIKTALNVSISKSFIIEDFIELKGYQSSADYFAYNGKLVYSDFSDQLFDINAENPYTPSIEIWPSTMKKEYQNELCNEIQRLFNLLNIRTGIFNIESRVSSNGKAYIMEVSPRGGGNRIAEIQRLGSKIDLIEAEVKKAVGDDNLSIFMPEYDSCYVNVIIHSYRSGKFDHITFDKNLKTKYLLDSVSYIKKDDPVEEFKGANNAIGSAFLKFTNREEADKILKNINQYIRVEIV